MICRSAAVICAVAVTAQTVHAVGALPEPVSYTKPVADKKYVFVMLGDPASEAKQSQSAQREFQALRDHYPQSGLYLADSGQLVWAIDAPYAPYDNTFLTTDGVHLVRLEGDWWIERDYPSPSKRLSSDEESKQFESIAVAFYTNGKRIRSYMLKDLVTNPLDLKHSPRYVLWAAGSVLNEPAGRFLLMIQDATRVTFDYRTGDIIAIERIGLNNPILGRILLVCGILSIGILVAWAWFALRTRPQA